MSDVNHEQVNLMLRLYDIRREPRLREARDWFLTHFNPKSVEDVMTQCPPGSQENAFMRMVFSYWEMVASIVNRGLIDEDFFFENTGEQWVVSGTPQARGPRFPHDVQKSFGILESRKTLRNLRTLA